MSEHPVDENTELIARIESAISLAFEGEGEAWSDQLSGDRLASVATRAIEELVTAALAKSERAEAADSKVIDILQAQIIDMDQKLTEQEDYWRNRMENGPWSRADANLMLQAQIAEQAATIEAVREWRDENQAHEVYDATDDEPEECTDDCEWCVLDGILTSRTGTTEQEGN